VLEGAQAGHRVGQGGQARVAAQHQAREGGQAGAGRLHCRRGEAAPHGRQHAGLAAHRQRLQRYQQELQVAREQLEGDVAALRSQRGCSRRGEWV
jgi:hypothetical protein